MSPAATVCARRRSIVRKARPPPHTPHTASFRVEAATMFSEMLDGFLFFGFTLVSPRQKQNWRSSDLRGPPPTPKSPLPGDRTPPA